MNRIKMLFIVLCNILFCLLFYSDLHSQERYYNPNTGSFGITTGNTVGSWVAPSWNPDIYIRRKPDSEYYQTVDTPYPRRHFVYDGHTTEYYNPKMDIQLRNMFEIDTIESAPPSPEEIKQDKIKELTLRLIPYQDRCKSVALNKQKEFIVKSETESTNWYLEERRKNRELAENKKITGTEYSEKDKQIKNEFDKKKKEIEEGSKAIFDTSYNGIWSNLTTQNLALRQILIDIEQLQKTDYSIQSSGYISNTTSNK